MGLGYHITGHTTLISGVIMYQFSNEIDAFGWLLKSVDQRH